MRGKSLINCVKDICFARDIEYESQYLTFDYKGKHYQVYRINKGNRIYRLQVKKGNKCISNDFSEKHHIELLTRLNEYFKGVYDDDFNN